MCEAVARNLGWLRLLPRGPEREAWRALELAIEDHNRRIVSLVLNVLAALGAGRAVAHLRHSLAAADQRTRANALEALLALPQRRLLQPILPLLEASYAVDASVAGPAAVSAAELAAIPAAASRADDRWIRVGAACTASALRLAPAAPRPGRPPTAGRAGSGARRSARHHAHGARHGADPVAQARAPVPLSAARHAAGGQPGAGAPSLPRRRDHLRSGRALGPFLLRRDRCGRPDLGRRPGRAPGRPGPFRRAGPGRRGPVRRRRWSPPATARCCACTGSCSTT